MPFWGILKKRFLPDHCWVSKGGSIRRTLFSFISVSNLHPPTSQRQSSTFKMCIVLFTWVLIKCLFLFCVHVVLFFEIRVYSVLSHYISDFSTKNYAVRSLQVGACECICCMYHTVCILHILLIPSPSDGQPSSVHCIQAARLSPASLQELLLA